MRSCTPLLLVLDASLQPLQLAARLSDAFCVRILVDEPAVTSRAPSRPARAGRDLRRRHDRGARPRRARAGLPARCDRLAVADVRGEPVRCLAARLGGDAAVPARLRPPVRRHRRVRRADDVRDGPARAAADARRRQLGARARLRRRVTRVRYGGRAARHRGRAAGRGADVNALLLWLGVALLGGVGAVARFLFSTAVARRSDGWFPSGTLAVNLSGTALLGLLAG